MPDDECINILCIIFKRFGKYIIKKIQTRIHPRLEQPILGL